LPLAVTQLILRLLALGDMPANSPVADKTSSPVEYRQPGDGYIALAAIGRRSRELKISEWQVGIEGLAVLAPALLVRLEVGHFPPCLADLGAWGRRVNKAFGELLADKAMLRIALPVHVEGELYEGTKALFARTQLLLCPLALRDMPPHS